MITDDLGNVLEDASLWRHEWTTGTSERLFTSEGRGFHFWVDERETRAAMLDYEQKLWSMELGGGAEPRLVAAYWGAASRTIIDDSHAWGFAGSDDKELYRVPLDGSSDVEHLEALRTTRYPRSVIARQGHLLLASGEAIMSLDTTSLSGWNPLVNTTPHAAHDLERAGSSQLVVLRGTPPTLGVAPASGGTPLYVARQSTRTKAFMANDTHVYLAQRDGYDGRCQLVRASYDGSPTREHLLAVMPFMYGPCPIPTQLTNDRLVSVATDGSQVYAYVWPVP
jgi:hypothetical protein